MGMYDNILVSRNQDFNKGGCFMKKWYQWFYLSLIFAIGGILSYFDGRGITAAIIQISITVILGFTQFLCDQKGETGKKVFKYISIAAIAILIIWMIYLALSILR
jgi:hypothetical protein